MRYSSINPSALFLSSMTDKSVKLHSVLLKGRKSLPLNVVSTETQDIFEHFSGIIDRLAENCSAIYINACVWKYCKSREFTIQIESTSSSQSWVKGLHTSL